MDRDLYDQFPNPQQQHRSALTRYRSAPSSFFAGLLDDDDGDGGPAADHHSLLNPQSSSESETVFPTTADKTPYSSIFQTSLDPRGLVNQNESWVIGARSRGDLQGLYHKDVGVVMENSDIPVSGCSNLLRQSSSPAGFFSALTSDTGFGDTKDMGSFRTGNAPNGKASPSNRLNGVINFSSGPCSSSRFMPKINETGNGTTETTQTSFQNDSYSGFTGLKRNRDDDESQLFGFNALNGDSSSYASGLTHHMSLPKTPAEMAALEKFLQLQKDSIPCKIRAKRGCATHPRSIAERTRRTKISERMRKLQELFPKMDKQTSTSDMLDWTVEYIKDLQKELKTLTDKRSKCTCSGEGEQFPNPTL